MKTDDGGSPVKKDPDAASHDSEKKDPEKGGEEGGDKKMVVLQQHLDRAKEVGISCWNRCRQRFEELDRDKKLIVLGGLGLLFLILFIIIICVAATPAGYSNESRILSEGEYAGKYVETHTTCGPIQGYVQKIRNACYYDYYIKL